MATTTLNGWSIVAICPLGSSPKPARVIMGERLRPPVADWPRTGVNS